MRPIYRVLAAVAACAVLAACDGGSSGASPSPSASGVDETQILAVARRYAQCMREHGIPSFGEPSVRDGRLRGFAVPPEGPPPEDVERTADESCRQILAELPTSVTEPEMEQADIEKLVQFAKCMRENGIPEWPDPRSDGSFPIHGTPLVDKTNERVRTAMDACKQYAEKGLSIS